MSNSSLNIYQRLNEVRKVVQYAQKDKSVQSYKAVSHDNVVALTHDEMVKNGILTLPEQLSGKLNDYTTSVDKDGTVKRDSMRMYEGQYNIWFVNIDRPEDRVPVKIEAHAMDNGDKAPGKALTYATKAALLKILYLETGENEESRVSNTRPITVEQADMIKTKLGGDPARIKKFCETYWIESVEDLPKADFNDACEKIDASNARNTKTPYPEDKFKTNLPSWTKLIKAGTKTAADIIATVESKSPLTDEQKKAITDIKPEAAQ